MSLSPKLTERIEAIAKREGRTPDDLLASLLDTYESHQVATSSVDQFIGAFDDDVTDMSVTVRETLRKKFEKPDDRSA